MSKNVLYSPTVGQLVTIRPPYTIMNLYANHSLQHVDGMIGTMSTGEIGCVIQVECRLKGYHSVECNREICTSIRLLTNGMIAWVEASYVVCVNDM